MEFVIVSELERQTDGQMEFVIVSELGRQTDGQT